MTREDGRCLCSRRRSVSHRAFIVAPKVTGRRVTVPPGPRQRKQYATPPDPSLAARQLGDESAAAAAVAREKIRAKNPTATSPKCALRNPVIFGVTRKEGRIRGRRYRGRRRRVAPEVRGPRPLTRPTGPALAAQRLHVHTTCAQGLRGKDHWRSAREMCTPSRKTHN